MKVIYRTSLPSLVALLFLLAACSPKYGAHFAPSQQAPKVVQNDKTEMAAPLVVEAPLEAPAVVSERALAAGATEVTSDVKVTAEKPALQFNTKKEQRKVIRTLRDKLKGMSKAEQQAFKEQVLRQLQEQQLSMRMAEEVQGEPRGANNINPVLLTIVTIFIPPLGVFLHQGEINSKFWISLVLTILFYIPGLIYSLLVIFNVV